MEKLILVLIALLIISCINKPDTSTEPHPSSSISLDGYLVADTIIYDVIIKSSDPTDKWENQRLQNVNQSLLIDSLFELVYNKHLIAYDVFENKALTISEVKAIEDQPDFARDRIGKIQFTEKWYFDGSNQQLQKQIISIALGYETYNENGNVRAYKPVFELYFD